VKLEARRLELGELVRACVEDHRADIEAKALTVRVAHRESLWVDGDSTRLCQIIGNLLNNAVKYTPPGGAIEVTLREETAQGDRRAVLSVKDSGAGITAELMPCIFEPFQQGVSTIDRANGGLGLGLALVKGLVELHQGEVVGKSDGDGKGSEFVVQLPLRAPPSSPVREARPPLSGAQRKCRVLVVEDNVDAAESLREVLELGGHVVDLAFSGGEGIEKAKLLRPDVVLCDIGLPNVNGYDVARKLRADPALDATLLVALTGYAGPSDRERAAEAGFDEHLAKPPNLKKLSVLLERVIAGVDCAN
jgi:two-component system CheB/CheR fusion protein